MCTAFKIVGTAFQVDSKSALMRLYGFLRVNFMSNLFL